MKIVKQLVLALGIVSLAACGGGGSSGESGSTGPITNDVESVSNTGSAPSTTPSGSATSTGSTSGSSSSTTSSTTTSTTSDGTGTSSNGTSTSASPAPAPVLPARIAVSWDIPAAREDGSYLAVYEIDGYELRYSKDSSSTETVVRIDDAQTTDWALENAQPGQYEFTIATIDSEGVYSQFSAPATKTVD